MYITLSLLVLLWIVCGAFAIGMVAGAVAAVRENRHERKDRMETHDDLH